MSDQDNNDGVNENSQWHDQNEDANWMTKEEKERMKNKDKPVENK